MYFNRVKKITGRIQVPGDKSISHRAVMFGALADGMTEIHGFLQGADCLSTISCFKELGIRIENDPARNQVKVYGKGLHGLSAPSGMLDVGNSGTTMRLISGILSGQPFESNLTGDDSIKKRPMGRIIKPLSLMGADIISIPANNCAPLRINGSLKTRILNHGHETASLKGIHYESPVASAQIKSSILLAGLYADAPTSVTEPYVSRNHSEIMLRTFGADVKTEGTTATIKPDPILQATKVTVPGDISSAAYFIAAGLMVPDSELVIEHVGINPTRDGILEVCRMMGADLTLENESDDNGEPYADIHVKTSSLKGITIGGSLIPRLIDELPVIAVLACAAEGTTIIKDAQELKVKESNRIDVMVQNLSSMGADITATEDGMIIHGGKSLHGAVINSKKDHRIAMSFAIASLIADGTTTIQDTSCVTISYPTFYQDLKRVSR
ncbi:MAG: 3-phosphoshikimate 1-carboxyvinyltransferase [Lachnospiraceae bacterium]|nr:3-phosphoshikimate 1-carboxyvinyltransferase [Lachnospiraceae bacterium]